METNGWRNLEELFDTASRLKDEERAAYLTCACAGDDRLRQELKSLLDAFEKQPDFLEETAFNLGLKAMAADSAGSLAGKTVGSYNLLRLLGAGGMGEVYLAEDTRLGRQVALKFLAAELVGDKWAKRQLIREAQAVARLDHPNICAVYGLEEADGHSFIVMQYVEGDPLTRVIPGRKARWASAPQTLALALQIAGALAEAHSHGIIHRDVKPQNIMVTARGQVKVLDFGLAKIIQQHKETPGAQESPSQVSQVGLIAGTVAYMSPEQLRAEKLDYRTDIFSLGVALYELATGRHPFAQESDAETIASILTSQPPRAPLVANGLASRLDPIIRKCLEKDKERRYQSASELLLDLQNLQTGNSPRWRRPRFNPFVTAAIFVLFVAGALLAYFRLTGVPTLVILPFTNESPGTRQDYLVAGLSESLANQLARLPQMKIKAPTTVSGEKGKQADLSRIGRELDVGAAVIGRAVKRGESTTLQVQLVKTSDAKLLWEESFDLDNTDALGMQDTIAAEIAAHLRLRLDNEAQKSLRTRQTSKTEAFHEYLRGRYYWKQRKDLQLAIAHFRQATKLDPEYACAYTGLADSYVLLTSVAYGQVPTEEAMTNAKMAVNLALKINPSLPEAHTSRGVISLKYDWNWQEAEANFQEAIRLNQNYAPAHYWYSHLLLITGRAGEAIAESEIARNLDPFSLSMNLNRCQARFQARQYYSADRCLNEMLINDPDNEGAQYVLGLVYQEQGKSSEAIGVFEKLRKTKPVLAAAPLGYAYGRVGRRDDALKILAEVEELWEKNPLLSQEIAIIHIGLGDNDKAFMWLEKARQERFAYLIYLTVEPLFSSLHPDPRFARLAQQLNLPLPAT